MKMNVVFLEDCAADGCYKKNVGDGKQLCRKHQDAYERGEKVKAFYGRTIQKKEFQRPKDNSENVKRSEPGGKRYE